MGYIEDTFGRMNLQQICSFLIEGVDTIEQTSLPFAERLKIESNPIYERLHSLYPNNEELEEAAADLAQALTAYESVYMEIGMKAGARLIFQLLHTEQGFTDSKE